MQASEIASAINIHQQHLLPASDPNHTPMHNQPLQKLTFAIQQTFQRNQPPDQEESPPPSTPPSPQPQSSVSLTDSQLLEYTLAAMKVTDPSHLLTFATRTLHASCGFERVLLAFVVPGKEKLEAKICHGSQADEIQAAFHCPLKKGNFWYNLLHHYQPIQFLSLVDEDQSNAIPIDFLQLWGKSPGFAGALYAPNKPIGVMLADQGSSDHPLTDKDFAAFSLVLSQTNANLARLAHSH